MLVKSFKKLKLRILLINFLFSLNSFMLLKKSTEKLYKTKALIFQGFYEIFLLNYKISTGMSTT